MSSELGREYEELAAKYLTARGYKILASRWACPSGELDLVVSDGVAVVFVEVRARTSNAYGFPVETVTRRKQEKIIKTALAYLKTSRLRPETVRFDVIGFGPECKPEHIVNAFEAQGYTY